MDNDGHKPDALHEAIALMARLRAPDGCPWDREQTFDSLMRHTLEETYEVFDAIERRSWPDLKDELGDLLLQILFYSQLAAEAGHFTIEDVATNLNAKLIRRHPHVFADETAENAAEVKVHWERIKAQEREHASAAQGSGLLDRVPRYVPAMMEAVKLGQQAAKVGLDWPDHRGVLAKLLEEIDELQIETSTGKVEAQTEELGDLLFTVVHLARHLKIEPEFALRAANAKFRKRFELMERFAAKGKALEECTPEELEAMWQRVKRPDSLI